MVASVYNIRNMQLPGMVYWFGVSSLLVKKKTLEKDLAFERPKQRSLPTQQISTSKMHLSNFDYLKNNRK